MVSGFSLLVAYRLCVTSACALYISSSDGLAQECSLRLIACCPPLTVAPSSTGDKHNDLTFCSRWSSWGCVTLWRAHVGAGPRQPLGARKASDPTGPKPSPNKCTER
jgi:hypothetical protein